MAMIYVKTKPGRKAFFQGKVIPQDKFFPVTDTPYIRRLIHVWEDLEVQGGEAKPKAKSSLAGASTLAPTPKSA